MAKTTKKTTAKKTTTAKKATKAKTTKAKATKTNAAELAELNETGVRKSKDRRAKKTPAEAAAAAPTVERRKVQRRRQIDPTTCERDYSELEIEFMQAMDEYKRASGRMFPTCSEILEVLNKLGYRQIESPAELMYEPKTSTEQKSEEDKWNENMDEDR